MYTHELFSRMMTGIRGQSHTHEHRASSAVPHPPKLQSVSEGHAGKPETSARLRLRVLFGAASEEDSCVSEGSESCSGG